MLLSAIDKGGKQLVGIEVTIGEQPGRLDKGEGCDRSIRQHFGLHFPVNRVGNL